MNRIAWHAVAITVLLAGCKSALFQTANRQETQDPDRRGTGDRGFDRREPSNMIANRMGRTPTGGGQQSRVVLAKAMRDERDGRLQSARSGYEAVLQIDRGNATAHHRLAVLADKSQDFRAANTHYAAALLKNRRDADLLNDYGMSLWMQNRLKEAEDKFKQAQSVDPRHMKAGNNLKALYAQLDAIRPRAGDTRSPSSFARNDRGYDSRRDTLSAPSPHSRRGDPRLSGLPPEVTRAMERERNRSLNARRDSRLYDQRDRSLGTGRDRYTTYGSDRRNTVPDSQLGRRITDIDRGMPTNRWDDRSPRGDNRIPTRDVSVRRDYNDVRYGNPRRDDVGLDRRQSPDARSPYNLAFPPRDDRTRNADYTTPPPDYRLKSGSLPEYRQRGAVNPRSNDDARDALRQAQNTGVGMPFRSQSGETADRGSPSLYPQSPATQPAADDTRRSDRRIPDLNRGSVDPSRSLRPIDGAGFRDPHLGNRDYRSDRRDDGIVIRPRN